MINQSFICSIKRQTNKSLQRKVYMNKTCQAHRNTYGSRTETNQKTIYTLKAHWQFKRLRLRIISKKFSKIDSLNGTPKLVNVLKSAFLGSEFHTFTIRSLKMLLLPEMHSFLHNSYLYLWRRWRRLRVGQRYRLHFFWLRDGHWRQLLYLDSI